MEKITINNKVYNIPNSWEDMSFEQFLKLSDYLKSIAEIQDDYPDEIFYSNLLKILTNTPAHSIQSVSVVDINKFKTSMAFIATKFENAGYEKTLEHDGLIIKIKNFETLTFGEYTDLLHLSNIKSQYQLIRLLANMCDIYQKRDIKKLRFSETKLNFTNEEKEQIIKALPATKANAVTTFFLHGQKQSLRNIVSYSNKVARRTHTKVFFQAVGLIIYGLWMRVMKILLSLVMLLTFRLDQSLRIWRTKLPRII
jgi:hypothetical protein